MLPAFITKKFIIQVVFIIGVAGAGIYIFYDQITLFMFKQQLAMNWFDRDADSLVKMAKRVGGPRAIPLLFEPLKDDSDGKEMRRHVHTVALTQMFDDLQEDGKEDDRYVLKPDHHRLEVEDVRLVWEAIINNMDKDYTWDAKKKIYARKKAP